MRSLNKPVSNSSSKLERIDIVLCREISVKPFKKKKENEDNLKIFEGNL